MSSPFNPLSALTPGGTPGVGTAGTPGPLTAIDGLAPNSAAVATASAGTAGAGASPYPFLGASPVPTPGTPWLQLVGMGASGTPGMGLGNLGVGVGVGVGGGGLPLGLGGGTPLGGLGLGLSSGLSNAGGVGAPSVLAQAANDADETVRAIPDIVRLIERAEAMRSEIGALERGLFGAGEGAERAGPWSRLEALQLDYAQTLATLISLAETYLVGALPANLSAVTGADPSNPAGTATAAGTPAAAVGTGAAPPTPALALTPSVPTLSELAAWTEARAQTTFARREAVRNASRAVSDVLKGVRT